MPHTISLNQTQLRVQKVLERLQELSAQSPDDAEGISEMLETSLSELHGDDFFGTEGQSDPRGDFRDGRWTMSKVQGVDDN